METLDWVPIVFVTFKALVLVIGMYYAIRWHYDQGKKHKDKQQEKRAVLPVSYTHLTLPTILLV